MYNPKIWYDGDIVTSGGLNNIEQGIAQNAHDIKTVNDRSEDLSADTTELKSDLINSTGNEFATFESGYRDMATPFTVTADSNFKCALIPCTEGQQFQVKGSGGITNQLWMFFKENGDVFEVSSGDNKRLENFETIIAPPESAYLVVNSRVTEEPTYVGDCIINSLLRDDIESLKNKPLRKYTQEGFDVSTFASDSGASDWFWANNETFPAGYVDHFVVYGTNNSIGGTAYIAVYDKALGKFVWKSEGVTAETRRVEIPCKSYFEHEIYVFASLKDIAHESNGNIVKYANMWEFAVWSEGAVFDIEWQAPDVKFKFAIECWYDDYVDLDNLHYAKAKNRMFVAGDSITAGYPYTSGISRPNYYDPDIRWGAQVQRKLGFDVTFGAQTGAGWLYRPSSDAQYAISIADNTNFANYDTVVFAFGTNDYGNNMLLGDIKDMYPTQNTVMGAINYVVNKVYTDNPKAVLIISSPINRSDVGTVDTNFGYGTQNQEGYTLLDLITRMKELCSRNGLCFIDNSNSPFNKYTLGALLMDNLHPNPDGYKILGSLLADRISHFVTPYTKNILTAECDN